MNEITVLDREPATVTPLSADVLLKMIQQNDEKAEDGHHRLRDDHRELESRIDRLEATINLTRSDLIAVKAARIEVSQLRLSPGVVYVIVITIVSLLGGLWTIKDSISDLKRSAELQRLKTDDLTNKVLDVMRRVQ